MEIENRCKVFNEGDFRKESLLIRNLWENIFKRLLIDLV